MTSIQEARYKIKEYITEANIIIGNTNLEWIDEKVIEIAKMIQKECHKLESKL